MKYTVDRRTWYRGHSVGSRLLRDDGGKCCIGFVGQQCGISNAELFDMQVAYGVPSKLWPTWMTDESSADIWHAYHTNDDENITDEVREVRLQTIFARHGDEIEFVN
jgi:hypothetical protein